MQVLVVIRQREGVPLAEEVVPEEGNVHIGKAVWDVRHPCPVCEVGRCGPDLRPLLVAHVHLREVPADAQPVAEAIPEREVVTFRLHLAVVHVSSRLLASAQVGNIALDIIFRIAIDESPFGIERVATEGFVVAHVQVDIIAILRTDTYIAHLQVLVAEHLLDRGQTVRFLVRELRLQLRQDKVSTCRPVTHRADIARCTDIVALCRIFRHRTGYKLVVIFPEHG